MENYEDEIDESNEDGDGVMWGEDEDESDEELRFVVALDTK